MNTHNSLEQLYLRELAEAKVEAMMCYKDSKQEWLLKFTKTTTAMFTSTTMMSTAHVTHHLVSLVMTTLMMMLRLDIHGHLHLLDYGNFLDNMYRHVNGLVDNSSLAGHGLHWGWRAVHENYQGYHHQKKLAEVSKHFHRILRMLFQATWFAFTTDQTSSSSISPSFTVFI